MANKQSAAAYSVLPSFKDEDDSNSFAASLKKPALPSLHADLLVNETQSTSSETEDTPETTNLVDTLPAPGPEVDLPPIKTLLALSFSYHFVYSAYNGLQNLQSTINETKSLGVLTLAIIYGMFLVTGQLGPSLLRHFSSKNLLLAAWCCMGLYISANFHPSVYTLIPAALITGGVVITIGTTSFMYTTAISDSYIARKKLGPEKRHGILSIINGVFYTFWEATQVTGNILSSLILFLLSGSSSSEDQVPVDISLCGAQMCPSTPINATAIIRPEKTTVYILLGSFLALVLIGALVTAIFLPRLPVTPPAVQQSICQEVIGCYKMLLDLRCAMLLPLFMGQAMMVMTLISGLTSAFISCTLGMKWVGFIMMMYGASSAVFATMANSLARYLGRQVLITVFICIDSAIILTLLLWQPNGEHTKIILFGIATIAGISEGISQPQFNALLSTVFKEKLAFAYVAYTMAKCASYSVCLALAALLCLYQRLYITLTLYALGFVGYVFTETIVHRKKSLSAEMKI